MKRPPLPAIPFRVPINAPLKRRDYDDRPNYIRKAISNREGFRRIDLAKRKLEKRDNAKSVICDVCHRRVRAWRIVPSLDGKRLGGNAATFGRVLVCCDTGPEGCAAKLTRAGVPQQAIAQAEACRRLGIVMPWTPL
jgi:hypothetical protein